MLNVAAGVAEVMQRIVAGLLRAAPVGIFALAVPLASGLGMTAAAAVFAYIGLVVGLTAAATLLLYPLALVAGRLRLPAFASYCAPAQALSFTARSSLAALPSMLECAATAGLPARAAAIMPIALSTFHFGAAIAQTVGALFVARVYDIALAPLQTGIDDGRRVLRIDRRARRAGRQHHRDDPGAVERRAATGGPGYPAGRGRGS